MYFRTTLRPILRVQNHTREGFSLRKRIAVLILSLMVVLSACSNNNSSNGNASTSTPAPKVVLKSYMYGTGAAKDMFDAMNKKFEEMYPNITIESEMAPSDQFDAVIKTKLASGDAPDIFGIRPGAAGQPIVDAGYLMDLSGESWTSHIYPALKPTITYGGKVYGLPLEGNFIATVYNKKIFNDLGLKVPTTYSELLAVCESLKKAGIIPMALGLKTPYVNQVLPFTLSASLMSTGDQEIGEKISSGKATYEGSQWKDVMDLVMDMKGKGYFNEDATGTSYDQAVQLFTTGKAAMITNGNWVLGSIKGANPNMEIGVMPLPATENPDDIRVLSSLIVAMGASAKTKHPEEVKKYLEYLATPGTINDYLILRGALSPFDNVTIETSPDIALINDYIIKGKSANYTLHWHAAVQGKFITDSQAVYMGALTTEQMMKNMDAENQAAINNK